MENRVAMYRGKRADELTREELIEAYTRLVMERAEEQERQFAREEAEMEQLFSDTAKALGFKRRGVVK